ncbi:predicted protein [Naegleria gruberi]|uniref:Predicted protein n=1 Tax=Naegleria gruberi TaxID=5762 RepID=D2VJ39_NAEGR|nr:uncharacterized protein NAEGRDRAFT_49959 [Naegleria gruberi]EFC43210.1 predicted protein [Naegleria gruberi]|eukprot:XP_002675954.1 predicted protein [Naegleria gruberi strain NEG-M]
MATLPRLDMSCSSVNTTNTTTTTMNNHLVRVVESEEMTSRSPSAIQEQLKLYHSIEAIVELNDDCIEVLKEYLKRRKNEEMLSCLQHIALIRNSYSNNTQKRASPTTSSPPSPSTSSSPFGLFKANRPQITSPTSSLELGEIASLKVKQFQNFYNTFIDMESKTCVNLPSAIRQLAQSVYQSSTSFSPSRKENISHLTTIESIDRCMEKIDLALKMQFNNEIMPTFKKTPEFITFLLTRVIELSNESSPVVSIQTSKPPTYLVEDMLNANEMGEYVKVFAKKKLITVDQLKNFTTDDYRDKFNIKKIGHLKRISRLVNEYCTNNNL